MPFALNQTNDGAVQSATLAIPGCGNQHVRGGSSVAVEIEGDRITLFVFGDINTEVPTHEIDISGALEKNRTHKEAAE